MVAQKNYIRIEILANGTYRGEVHYPYSPLFKLDVDDMVRFIYEKRQTMKYEKEFEIWLNGKHQAFIKNK